MKYCTKCGAEMVDEAVVCVSCGAEATVESRTRDRGGFGWGLLGCCVPIAGLVLYLVWRDSHPKNAKAAGVGALVYLISIVVFYIAYAVLFGAIVASQM